MALKYQSLSVLVTVAVVIIVSGCTGFDASSIGSLDCNSCSDCNSKIQNAKPGDVVSLKASINNHKGSCINLIQKNNITFQCSGNSIDGQREGYGILLESASYNIISDCLVTDFDKGVEIKSCSNNTISNLTLESDCIGVNLDSASNIILSGLTINSSACFGYQIASPRGGGYGRRYGNGIAIYQGSNNQINKIINSGEQSGLSLSSSSSNEIIDSIFTNRSRISIISSTNNSLSNIEIKSGLQGGVYFKSSYGNRLKRVEILRKPEPETHQDIYYLPEETNISALYYDDSSYPNYIDNTVTINGRAVQYFDGLYKPCPDNQIISYNDTYSQIVFVGCNNVTLNSTTLTESLYLFSMNNSKIFNVNSSYSSSSGIYLYNGFTNLLENITVSYNQNGLYLSSSSANNMVKNFIANENLINGIEIDGYNNELRYIFSNFNKVGILLSSNNNIADSISNENSDYGISLDSNNTLTNVTANSNRQTGINLDSSMNNVFKKVVTNNNIDYGMNFWESSNNNFSNIIANNNGRGIWINFNSDYNYVTDSRTDSNRDAGISIFDSSHNKIMNTTSNFNDNYGIYLRESSDNILSDIISTENTNFDVYLEVESYSDCSNSMINITGSGNLPIKYLNLASRITDEQLSELILCYAHNSIAENVTVIGSSNVKNNGILILSVYNSNLSDINLTYSSGLRLYSSNGNTISHISAKFNKNALYLTSSDSNKINNADISYNQGYGIFLEKSKGNTIEDVLSNYNKNGIIIDSNFWDKPAKLNSFQNITLSNNIENGITIYMLSQYNVIKDSIIENNANYGIYLDARGSNYHPINNGFYNNYISNFFNFGSEKPTYFNYWNTTFNCLSGTNILGGLCIGGNYWATPNGTGFSETCEDSDKNGICDSNTILSTQNVDYLPLSK